MLTEQKAAAQWGRRCMRAQHCAQHFISIKPVKLVFYCRSVFHNILSMMHHCRNRTGCGIVGGGGDKTERNARGKAVEENDRKADFMLGGLHLIFALWGGAACGPANGFTATWWCVSEVSQWHVMSSSTACIRRPGHRRKGEPFSWEDENPFKNFPNKPNAFSALRLYPFCISLEIKKGDLKKRDKIPI